MRLTLVRNATLLLDYAGERVLVDPMFSEPNTLPPVENTAPPLRNPLVPLPAPVADFVSPAALVLLTHLHRDHFDPGGQSALPPQMPIICQPADRASLIEQGFAEAVAVRRFRSVNGMTITRVAARHAVGRHERQLGPCSGFVLAAPGEPTLHIAGDCVWCPELAAVMRRHRPDIVVVNAGAARFLDGGPISMTAEDVIAAARHAPYATVVAVHLEALNHCPMTRAELRRHLVAAGLAGRVRVPADGETLCW